MNKKLLTLSIVIPVYNEERHIKACLEAIAAQTAKPDEVIVVDNNSTDSTLKIVKRYPFVKLLHEPKQSVLFARNRGFDAVKSDLIARIDGDTIVPPGWVAIIKKIAADRPNVSALTGPVGYYDMPLPRTNYNLDHQIRLHLYNSARHVPFLFGSNSVLRREAWQRIKAELCLDKTMHEDLDLAIHVVEAGLAIHYDRRLLAGVSARRYDDSPKAFRRYMQMYRHTYVAHGIMSKSPRIATFAYWSGYFVLRPLRLAYDDSKKQRSLKQLLRKHYARKNPMSD